MLEAKTLELEVRGNELEMRIKGFAAGGQHIRYIIDCACFR